MSRWVRALAYAAAAALVISIAFPLYWTVLGSLRPEASLYAAPSLAPRDLILDHYRWLFAARSFEVPLRNSLGVASATTLLCLVLGALCAYAIARLRFRGRSALLGLTLAVAMFPQIAVVSPLYLLLRALGLLDTFAGLVLPYTAFALPLTVWMLVGFFRQIPRELEEAALVDGANRLQALWHVVLPLAAPGLAATAILTFVFAWNEFLFALSFTVGPERQTLPVAIAFLRGRYEVPWGQMLAAAVIAVVQVAALVLLFQRRIVGGLTSGAVQG